jgi:hypothetical protein
MRETDLYGPVKAMLEAQGYEVKSEIGAADVVALRGEEAPVLVELKTAFSLALFHQAVDRLSVSDAVYLAVPEWKGRAGWKAFVANRTLCRRLGLGLMTVQTATGRVNVHLDPGPYAPRQSKPRKERLLREFQRRVGDPNSGGATRARLVTSYRQDALRCLKSLSAGPNKAAEIARVSGVAKARAILAADHYGWFERVERGIYAVTPKGISAIEEYRVELEALA